MERLTVSGLDGQIKKTYRKWCIDHTWGDLSSILLVFIHWIATVQPTLDEIDALLGPSLKVTQECKDRKSDDV